jgi:hypothetical protein
MSDDDDAKLGAYRVGATPTTGRVVIVDVRIPFVDMVILMVKASFAAAIAFAVTSVIWGAIGLAFFLAMTALGGALVAASG